MDIYYYRDPSLNFGDDLNELIWRDVLSDEALSAENVTLVGIGSILNDVFVPKVGHKIVVLGSGISYSQPPAGYRNWDIIAVRGPFTATIVGMPDKAVTDGAILLAASKRLIPPTTNQGDVVFIPHHKSVRCTPWKLIAKEAGLVYVSPQQPVQDVLSALSKAKLVVTEAMHGAIVADTMRIPWVPVISNPAIDEFKWRDWTLSMGLPYEPTSLSVGSAVDWQESQRCSKVLRSVGISGHETLLIDNDKPHLLNYLSQRFGSDAARSLKIESNGRRHKFVSAILRFADPAFRASAIRSLRRAALGPHFLSSDSMFERRLNQMIEACDAAMRIVRL